MTFSGWASSRSSVLLTHSFSVNQTCNRHALLMPRIAEITKSRQTSRGDRTSFLNRQLNPKARGQIARWRIPRVTEGAQKPTLTAKLEPGSHHHLEGDRYRLHWDHVKKRSGKLFYQHKVSHILAHFRGRSGLIDIYYDPSTGRPTMAFGNESVKQVLADRIVGIDGGGK